MAGGKTMRPYILRFVQIFFILIPFTLFSQSQFVELFHFDELGSHTADLLIHTADEGYAMAGHTPDGYGNSDLYIMKFDSLWNPEWAKRISLLNSSEDPFSLVQTSDGGYIIGGTVEFTQGIIVKLDSLGNLKWAKSFTDPGGANYIQINSVVETSNNEILVAGCVIVINGTPFSFLVRFDSLGNLLWSERLNSNYQFLVSSMIRTDDNGYALTGLIKSTNLNSIFLTKLDPTGNPEWTRFIDDPNSGGGSLTQTNDRGYMVVGNTASFGAEGMDILLLKFNSSGNLQYSRRVGSSSDEYIAGFYDNNIVQTADSGYCISAIMQVDSMYFPMMLKTDLFGIPSWAETLYFEGEYNEFKAVVQTWNNGYVAVGQKFIDVCPPQYFVLIAKFDSLGHSCKGGNVHLNIASISPTCLSADIDSTLLTRVTISPISPTIYPLAISREVLCENVKFEEINKQNPFEVIHCSSFFKNKIKIDFSSPSSNPLKIMLYDPKGTLIYKKNYKYTPNKLILQDERLLFLSPGTYFLKICYAGREKLIKIMKP